MLLGLGGCARLRGPQLPEDDSDIVTVSIVNHYKLNVTIYALVQGRRDRLGEATESFRVHLRRLIANEVQLYGEPIGSPQAVTSDLVHASPGDTVEWTLESDLGRSSIIVRS